MSILYYTDEGIEVNTTDLISSVTVSMKASLPRYGSVAVSYTATIPAGMASATVVDAVTADLLDMARQQVTSVAGAAWEAETEEAPPAPASPPQTASVSAPPAMEAPKVPERPASAPQEAPDGTPPLVKFMAARDRRPGVVYRTEVDEYEYMPDSQKLAFYGQPGKYAKITTYADRAGVIAAFNGYQFKGGRHPMPGGPVILTVRITDRLVNNYYEQEVVGLERPGRTS